MGQFNGLAGDIQQKLTAGTGIEISGTKSNQIKVSDWYSMEDVYITIQPSSWTALNGEYAYTYNSSTLNWNSAKKIHIGLPIPTTRANAEAFATANIIISAIYDGSTKEIMFQAKTLPTTAIKIAVNGIVL